LTHVGKGVERLLNAYQEALLSIEQLRARMPGLRQRQQALRAELQAIADQANDRAAFLRLAETLTAFLTRLRSAAETLNVTERQRIVRLVVKDVLVGDDTITIRHSIPVPSGPHKTAVRRQVGQTAKITFCVRGVISPVFSNLYLNEVDRMLERAIEATRFKQYTAIQYARFADDLVILVDSHSRHDWLVEAVTKRLREELGKLRVEINEEKSRIVDLRKGESFNFPGLRVSSRPKS
jgi:hypothetical protein